MTAERSSRSDAMLVMLSRHTLAIGRVHHGGACPCSGDPFGRMADRGRRDKNADA